MIFAEWVGVPDLAGGCWLTLIEYSGYLFWISLGHFGYACACLLVLEVDKVEIGFVVV